jgi:hypothetical protein
MEGLTNIFCLFQYRVLCAFHPEATQIMCAFCQEAAQIIAEYIAFHSIDIAPLKIHMKTTLQSKQVVTVMLQNIPTCANDITTLLSLPPSTMCKKHVH